jgi:hypothetical protein
MKMARKHQQGRVPEGGTTVSKHAFTEGWVRSPGLYDLNRDGGQRSCELRRDGRSVVQNLAGGYMLRVRKLPESGGTFSLTG